MLSKEANSSIIEDRNSNKIKKMNFIIKKKTMKMILKSIKIECINKLIQSKDQLMGILLKTKSFKINAINKLMKLNI